MLKRWIKVFYNKPSSCVLYNGFLSDSSNVTRGVRQGCPLSPYIFILAIELLSVEIRENKKTKGIEILGKEIKNSMFAEHATIQLDGSAESFEEVMQVFEEFSHISGLNLNYDKSALLSE